MLNFADDMKSRYFLLLLVAVAAVMLLPELASAQCAMCRASVESNAQNGNTQSAENLNNGILYLMSLPYIIFSVVGYFWYRSAQKRKAAQQAQLARRRAAGLSLG